MPPKKQLEKSRIVGLTAIIFLTMGFLTIGGVLMWEIYYRYGYIGNGIALMLFGGVLLAIAYRVKPD